MRGLPILTLAIFAALAAPARADAPSVLDLLTDCQASAAKCNDHFASGDLMAALMTTRCRPDDLWQAQDEIVAWLLRHPEEFSKDAEEGVRDAAAAIWPCEDGN